MAIREEAYVYGNTVRQPRVSIDRQTANKYIKIEKEHWI